VIMVLSGRSVLLSHGKRLVQFCSMRRNQTLNERSGIMNGCYIPMIQQLCSSMLIVAECNTMQHVMLSSKGNP